MKTPHASKIETKTSQPTKESLPPFTIFLRVLELLLVHVHEEVPTLLHEHIVILKLQVRLQGAGAGRNATKDEKGTGWGWENGGWQ